MSLGFSELIGRIEAEIKTEFVGDAINWADRNYNDAWSNAMLRFDKALAIAIERHDYALAKMEGEYYQATVLDLLAKYKQAMKISDTESFLASISSPSRSL